MKSGTLVDLQYCNKTYKAIVFNKRRKRVRLEAEISTVARRSCPQPTMEVLVTLPQLSCLLVARNRELEGAS